MVQKTQRLYMNLFVKSKFNCVFSSSLDWFHQSKQVGTKRNGFDRETKSFYALCLSHRRYFCYAPEGLLTSIPRGRRASTYNCPNNLGYIRGLNGKQKQLIKKLVHICMINGKKMRSRAIAYKTFHHLAPHGDVIKLLVNAIENVKPICEVKKVRISGTTRLVPSIMATNRQETLAIRWMLESTAKRRMGKKSISLDQCLYVEILEASQKMGLARKKGMIFINLLKPIVVFPIIDGGKLSTSSITKKLTREPLKTFLYFDLARKYLTMRRILSNSL